MARNRWNPHVCFLSPDVLKLGWWLPCDIGGAKESEMMYFPTTWAKEPQNPQNHRVITLVAYVHFWVIHDMIKCRETSNPPKGAEYSGRWGIHKAPCLTVQVKYEMIFTQKTADMKTHTIHGTGIYIYTYIGLIMVNVGKYTSLMDAMWRGDRWFLSHKVGLYDRYERSYIICINLYSPQKMV